MSERVPRYRRILLKLSGEALIGSERFGIDPQVLDRTAAEIAELVTARVEVADSAACLRGIEIGADVVLKGTKVDGVYSADPEVDPAAEFIAKLTYDEVLRRGLGVMDHTAICLCRDHHMPLRVFNMGRPGVLLRLVLGDEEAGTLITY